VRSSNTVNVYTSAQYARETMVLYVWEEPWFCMRKNCVLSVYVKFILTKEQIQSHKNNQWGAINGNMEVIMAANVVLMRL
jgi:hypothetical protein